MKTFFASLTGVLVTIILIVVVILFIGWSSVPGFISRHLSKQLNVSVDIGTIQIGWGKIGVKKIAIGNPPGAVQPQAFRCQNIRIQTPFNQFFKNQVSIDEIQLSDLFIDLEFDSASGTKGNWSRIMGNLQGSSSSAEKKGRAKQEAQDNDSSRSVYIHKLILTNIDVDVVYIKEGRKVIHLPRIERIELYDISSQGGLPMDQIMNSILGQMLRSVFERQNLKNMLQNLIESPPNTIQKYLNPFKLFTLPSLLKTEENDT